MNVMHLLVIKWRYYLIALYVPTRPPHSAHASTQDILNVYTHLFNFLTLVLIISTPHDVWIVENIFINNYTLEECTYLCITYSVIAQADDGQTWLKYVEATNWEIIYICAFY
jgi:hypothetical protein